MKDVQLTGIDDDDCSIHTAYEKFENDIRNILINMFLSKKDMLKQSATIYE